ncbi:MAG: hypothetical protein R3314_07280 [Longimicrobiales bacterium]|nr:hypothetical protein [Longimicrobiales bacterium]
MDARRRLVVDGLAAGLLGYAVVVVFFVVLNLMVGRSPFHTAALFGEAIFTGLRDPAALTLAPGPILAFNGVHMAAYLVFGFFGAWLVHETELHPQLWYLALFLFIAVTLFGYAAVLAMNALVGSLVAAWSVVAASLLSAVAMAVYLTVSHRSLLERVDEAQETRPGPVE